MSEAGRPSAALPHFSRNGHAMHYREPPLLTFHRWIATMNRVGVAIFISHHVEKVSSYKRNSIFAPPEFKFDLTFDNVIMMEPLLQPSTGDVQTRVFQGTKFVLVMTIALVGMSSCSSRLALKGSGDENNMEFTRAVKPARIHVSSRLVDPPFAHSFAETDTDAAVLPPMEGDTSGDASGLDEPDQQGIVFEVASPDLPDALVFSKVDEQLALGHTYGMARIEHSRSKEWKRQFQHLLKSAYAVAPSEEDGAGKGLVVAGIVILSLGFLVLLFLNWVIGLLLMLVGAALWIAGATGKKSGSTSSSERKKSEEQAEWQDVVYLKNGSIIKGLIVEQVPNESIKIQTADGSVFVHTMDQVAKITKEQKQ